MRHPPALSETPRPAEGPRAGQRYARPAARTLLGVAAPASRAERRDGALGTSGVAGLVHPEWPRQGVSQIPWSAVGGGQAEGAQWVGAQRGVWRRSAPLPGQGHPSAHPRPALPGGGLERPQGQPVFTSPPLCSGESNTIHFSSSDFHSPLFNSVYYMQVKPVVFKSIHY